MGRHKAGPNMDGGLPPVLLFLSGVRAVRGPCPRSCLFLCDSSVLYKCLICHHSHMTPVPGCVHAAHVCVCVCLHICVFLPACVWHLCLGPQHRGRLLTSPEVTPRPGVTHASPAPTCPCSCPEPPPLLARQRYQASCPGDWIWPPSLAYVAGGQSPLTALQAGSCCSSLAPCINLRRDN